MMDIKAYIASGVIEDYCLGSLDEKQMQEVDRLAADHPSIRKEIIACQQSVELYARSLDRPAPEALKENTLALIDNLIREESIQTNELPLLNKYSDSKNWLLKVRPLLPGKLEDDMFVHVLQDNEEVEQLLMWTRVDIPDEVHVLEKESFIVLEGECECYIDDKVIKLKAGEFIDIPMHAHHDVKVVKGPVLAIVQRLKKVA
jgi:mannose-6-phosphate isomerase-like protein (cupin superfamily)